jgi:hypothetical protein
MQPTLDEFIQPRGGLLTSFALNRLSNGNGLSAKLL